MSTWNVRLIRPHSVHVNIHAHWLAMHSLEALDWVVLCCQMSRPSDWLTVLVVLC